MIGSIVLLIYGIAFIILLKPRKTLEIAKGYNVKLLTPPLFQVGDAISVCRREGFVISEIIQTSQERHYKVQMNDQRPGVVEFYYEDNLHHVDLV